MKLDEKVKILRGEEEVRCEVTRPDSQRFKARTIDGRELGSAREDGPVTRLQEGGDTDVGRSTSPPSSAQAALFCTEVPPGSRAVIIAELVRRRNQGRE